MNYSYSAYGLRLESETAIAGLSRKHSDCERPISDRIDVTLGALEPWTMAALRLPPVCLYSSAVPNDAREPTFRLSELGPGQFFLFSYADGTRFIVDAEMRRVWGACQPPLTQEDLVTYLVGPVLGFLLRQRGVLALHASSFSKNGFAFALCGSQGVGKSTTVAALALHGVPVHSEDITALRERESAFWAYPGYPRVNLWPASTSNLFGTPEALPRITPNWEKRFLSLDGSSARFDHRERRIAAVYLMEPRTSQDNAPRIEELSPREATLFLVRNTYMNYLLGREQRAAEFDALARLASSVVVRRLTPHNDPARIESMCRLLEADSADIASQMTRLTARRLS